MSDTLRMKIRTAIGATNCAMNEALSAGDTTTADALDDIIGYLSSAYFDAARGGRNERNGLDLQDELTVAEIVDGSCVRESIEIDAD
jgi:hypothetical protein